MTLSYASDSGGARNCQQGVIARERSDQAGRVLKGFSPSHGREILLLKIILCGAEPLPGAQGAEHPEAIDFSANKGLQDGRQER